MQDFYTAINQLKKEFRSNPSIMEKIHNLDYLLAKFEDKNEKSIKAVDKKSKSISNSIIKK